MVSAAAITGTGRRMVGVLVPFHRKTRAQSSTEGRHAAEALSRLYELAARAAVNVDEHSSRWKRSTASWRRPAATSRPPDRRCGGKVDPNEPAHAREARLDRGEALRPGAKDASQCVEARTDALTLLANRRAFDEELARRIAEFRRHGRSYSLIMADVDRFKRFNDTYGHPAGDKVLQDVARMLRRKMREMDLVARYGGEEFAIILPGTNLNDASKAALRACEAIEKCPFRHDEKEFGVTVSFGVAEVLSNEDGAMHVTRADKALYAAKEGGRNCVYRHDGKTVERVIGNKERVVAESKGQPPSGPAACEYGKSEKTSLPPDADTLKPKPNLPRAWSCQAVSGLLSRTTFCRQVRKRTDEWKRGGPMFSVVLIRVDQYEQGGEHRGPEARKAAALAATRFLDATIREMDTVGHYGSRLLRPAVAHDWTCRCDPGGRAASGRVHPPQPLGAGRATETHPGRWGSAGHGRGRFHLAARTRRNSR